MTKKQVLISNTASADPQATSENLLLGGNLSLTDCLAVRRKVGDQLLDPGLTKMLGQFLLSA
jgi:hypothetical protein